MVDLDLPKDTNGWTIFIPSVTSRLCYVSATGNNGTAQYYSPSDEEIGADPFTPVGAILPYSTYAAAAAVCRVGYDDWVLFKRGDTFETQIVPWGSGADATYYALIGAYGSGALPVIYPTNQTTTAFIAYAQSGNLAGLNYFAMIDLDFYSYLRDPDSGNYVGTDGALGFQFYSNGTGYDINHILFEGCRFRFFGSNEFIVANGGTTGDIHIHRCVFLDNYREIVDGYSQGLWADEVDGFLLEECIFDHCGWYSYGQTSTPGPARIYHHSTYLYNCLDVTFENNIFLRSSSLGSKFTSDGEVSFKDITLTGNLWLGGEQALAIHNYGTETNHWENILVKDNVVAHMDYDNPTQRGLGWGMQIHAGHDGIIEGNLFIDWAEVAIDNTRALELGQIISNLEVKNNTVVRMNAHGGCDTGYAFHILSGTYSGISFSGNVLEELAEPHGMIFVQDAADIGDLTFSVNRYHAGSELFAIGGTTYDYAGWCTQSGESGSSFAAASFPAGTRSLAGYMTSLGETATIAAFIAKCRAMNRDAWDTDFAAPAVVNWLRGGYYILSEGTDIPFGVSVSLRF
jgi:hypothetical protein